MQKPKISAWRWIFGGGRAPAVAMVALAAMALAAMTLLSISVSAQESLGDRARRIRADKENAEAAKASPDGKKAMSPTAADLTVTMSLISETDPEKYAEGLRLLLEQDRFRVLDDIAAGERTNKTRFAGGEWKLHEFYEALGSPAGKGRGVVADWNAYRERMNKWVGLMPASITARVALAQAELL